MTRPGFATQQELIRWADSLAARGGFPRMVRRLVLETGRGVHSVDFPAAEGTAGAGWDGVTVADRRSPFVPPGLSLWELSVERSVNAKAQHDYDKRAATPNDSPTSDATYVAVSLRRWKDRRKFAAHNAKDKRWKEVRAYGIDDVETWLESAPITHAWISEQLGLKPHGMQTADAWWTAWLSATEPPLTTEIILAGRAKTAETLRNELVGRPQIVTIRGDSLDEVMAVVAASALGGGDDDRSHLLARMAFVDDVGTWRALANHDKPLVLVARTPEVVAEARSAPNHHVIVPLTGRRDADIELLPVDASAAADALRAAGFEDEQQADQTARLGRRSFLALRRRLAKKPELHTPPWARDPVERVARGVLVAGSWNDDAVADQRVLADLTGVSYDDLRERLTELAAEDDPLVTRVGSTWSVVSPYDAWRQLRTHLRPDDLSRLRAHVEQVLLEEDPALRLAPDERWKAGMQGKTREHSSDLRTGLVATVALLGVLGDRVDAGGGATGRDVASSLVRGILGKANEDASGLTWSALSLHLPLLAEAAPDAFLDAVRGGLVGDSPVLARLFQDGEGTDLMFSSSAHTGLLWALEVAAWSPAHFGQAVYLLARLAEVDPGGRLTNRPSNSLAAIYCPWHPETTATNQDRLEVLDEVRRRHPDVAWAFMVALLPEWHGVHFPTSAPRFRDWKPSKVAVTNVQFFEFITELVARLVIDAGADPSRWQKLVDESNHVSPADRGRIRDELSRRVDAALLAEEGRPALRDELRKMIARHREFAHTDWALPAEELAAFEAIERKLAPKETGALNAWLFEGHMPDLGEGVKMKDGEYDHARYTAVLEERRRDAVRDIERAEGWQGIIDLVARADVPWDVGIALSEIDRGAHQNRCLALVGSANANEERFATGYLSRRFQDEGWDWLERLLAADTLGATQTAQLLLLTHDHPKSWQRADELGEDIAHQYWRLFLPFGLGNGYAHVEETAQRLLAAGRPAAAVHLLVLYAARGKTTDPVLADVAADALDALLRAGECDLEIKGLQHFDFESIFAFLEQHRARVGPERVARLEWAFLPALGFEPTTPSIHEALASEPALFVEVLSAIYQPRSGPTPEASSQQQEIGTNAYRLLSSWRHLPGHDADGKIDAKALQAWVRAALPLLDEADRRGVGEIHIGHVLAFSPSDPDGGWPCAEVRDLLEELQSDRIEEGLETQIFNNRGVTTRNPEDGGEQERDLAKKYRGLAERFSTRWPRTAAILRSLADTYERDARRHDDEAERRRKGLGP